MTELRMNIQESKQWKLGYKNLLRRESSRIWGGLRWLKRSLLWVVLVNGFMAFLLFVVPAMMQIRPEMAQQEYDPISIGIAALFQVGLLGFAVAAIINTHNTIIAEKENGTISWLFSKPISRTAYVVSKLVSASVAIQLLIVLPVCVIAYAMLTFALGSPYSLVPFMVAVIGAVLHTLFYSTLCVMLGVLLSSRSRVLGIALGVLLGGMIVSSLLGKISLLTPLPLPNMLPLIATSTKLTLEMLLPLISSLVWSVIFIVISISRIKRIEL